MRKYRLAIQGVSISAAADLIVIQNSATQVLQILRAWAGQSGNVTSEQNEIALARVTTNNSTGATSLTARPLEVGDPATSITSARTTPTSLNTLSNSGEYLYNEDFNWVSGWLYVPAPEERIYIPPSGIVVLRLLNAPSAAKTVSAGINFLELG